MTTQPPTWTTYKTFIAGMAEKKVSFYCRGQSNDTWILQSSFHRVSSRTGMSLQQYFDVVIPELHYHICAVHNEIIDIADPNEFAAFLALIQHYGFPTPLLDWTLSPYIAAYFAMRDVDEDTPRTDHARIFLFDYLSWTNTYDQPLDFRNPKPFVSILRPHARNNTRLIPQQGVFTVSNVSDIQAHIIANQKDGKQFIWTVDIPVQEKPQVMRDLALMGINEMTLFPSVDGICRSLKAKFFSLDKIGPTLSERLAELSAQLKAKPTNPPSPTGAAV